MSTHYDISGNIGPLFKSSVDPKWPMYSYDRPAWILWNGIATGLSAKGWSEKAIKEWLQSKGPRWALDQDLGGTIFDLGEKYAQSIDADKEF